MADRRSSREFPARPLVGVGAVIIDAAGDGARVLLARRGRAPSRGEWSIPGGLVKVGETLEQALVREVREETGLNVRVGGMIEVLDRIIYEREFGAEEMKQKKQRTQRKRNDPAAPTDKRRVRYHYVIIDFLCRLAPRHAAPRAASDVTELRWATRAELPQFRLRPALLRVIDKGFQRCAAGSRE